MVPGLAFAFDGTPLHVVTTNVNNLNLGSTMFGAGGLPDPVTVRCVVPSGITVGSTSLGTVVYPNPNGEAALNLNDFAVGSLVILLNQGRIQGCGGNGGLGTTLSGLTYAGGSGGAGIPPGLGNDIGGIDAPDSDTPGGRSAGSTGVNIGNPNTVFPDSANFGSRGGHAIEGVGSCELALTNEGEIYGGGGGGIGSPFVSPSGKQGGAGGSYGEGGESSTTGPFPGPRDPDGAGYAIRVENGGPAGSGQGGIVLTDTGTILTTIAWP